MKVGIPSVIPAPLLWRNPGCRDQILKISGCSCPPKWCWNNPEQNQYTKVKISYIMSIILQDFSFPGLMAGLTHNVPFLWHTASRSTRAPIDPRVHW